MKPPLSIITPNYNNEMYLKDCFDGIVKQTYRPIEVVIVDDCSSDNSRDIILEYVNSYPWMKSIFLKENKGVSNARNAGAKKSSGEYITFLDSDDYYINEKKLELEMNVLLQQGKMEKAAFSQLKAVDKEGNPLWMYHTKKYFDGHKLKKDILCKADIQFPRDYCYKKELFISLGGYKKGMNLYEDTEFLLRLADRCEFVCTNQLGSAYRITNQGLSSVRAEEHKEAFGKLRKNYISFYSLPEKMEICFRTLKNEAVSWVKRQCRTILSVLGIRK